MNHQTSDHRRRRMVRARHALSRIRRYGPQFGRFPLLDGPHDTEPAMAYLEDALGLFLEARVPRGSAYYVNRSNYVRLTDSSLDRHEIGVHGERP